ncbi:LuxR C-terminal-related transcriptional regulator [Dactylosporangium sp. NPDC005572]|uniref:ATP-binding protein n=1 Tax=Dactylosporangium sp. NPDC005572 TaxID=3156889 RepID=UPI0033A7F96F
MTSFIGRRRELADVRSLLSESRAVTLTGVGGVGKTRLALRLAGELHRAFSDGVWLVDFSGLNDSTLLVPTVAAALGLSDAAAPWRVSRLAEHLAEAQILLVLDNCEHVVTECALLVDALLRSCPQLRVLVTSRQPLGVNGERVMQVPSLSIPRSDRPSPTTDTLMRYESVSLLAERATAAFPGFVVGPDNGEAVARLCSRLDGIPLAIELAAVRLRALSVHQVLDRLEDRYGLLRAGSPAAMPRQRTLRALIDWSFDLLTAREQLLWARVSVFAGSFELDSVEQVCADDTLPVESIAGLMAGLVDKSVVVREDHGGQARYRLLETIRQYGLDRLQEVGGQAQLLRRQRDLYLRLVLRTEAELFSPNQVAWYQRLLAELANIRAVLGYCLTEREAAGAGQRIAAALEPLWCAGMVVEGRRWLQRLLAFDTTPSADRMRALAVAGRLATLQGLDAERLVLLAEGRILAEKLGDDTMVAHLTTTEGLAELLHGRPSAVEPLEEALATYRTIGDLFGTAVTLTHLSSAWILHGDTDRAEALCQEILALSEAHGERWCAAHAWLTLGLIAWHKRDVRRAGDFGTESVRLRQPFGLSWAVAFSLELLAWLANAQGQSARAARLLGVARTGWRSLGAPLPVTIVNDHERCLTELRKALGPSAFEAAVQEGQALPLDEAVTFALGVKPDHGAAQAEPGAVATQLTRRETEIAELVADGLSNKEIAARLVIAQRTAECHVEHILIKLGYTSRAQIAAWVAGSRDR